MLFAGTCIPCFGRLAILLVMLGLAAGATLALTPTQEKVSALTPAAEKPSIYDANADAKPWSRKRRLGPSTTTNVCS